MQPAALCLLAAVALAALAGARGAPPPLRGQPAAREQQRIAAFWQWFLSLVGGSWLGGGGGDDVPEPTLQPAEGCQPCECGLPNKKTRIVGGHETQVNQYPWVAKLFYRGRFYCAGSLINAKYVLTAAHCLKGFDVRQVTVRLMEHDAGTDSEAAHLDFEAQYAVRHQRYSDSSFNNDIALLRLRGEAPLRRGGQLRPVCLPPHERNFTGELALATGWGTTAQGGAVSPVLREVQLPVLSNEECRRTGYGARRITDNMLCAGYPGGGKDSCQGDSGGPLHVALDGRFCVAGVVSWGDGCARPNYPGVYTRVNRFLSWLQAHTVDACPCAPPAAVAPYGPGAAAPAPVGEASGARRHRG